MMALLRQVANPGDGEGARWAQMRVHLVRNDIMATLGYSSKLNAEWDFLSMLHGEGRKTADEFLKTDGQSIGVRSTANLDSLLDQV
jgi:NTE family protein